ncbi:MAG: 3-isopropylmalate dehydrogenase, partial [Proteobacteria bacterium]|nr:3-isopropylmalate dehydrogenase [Pseudomonadota bacterium]
MSKTYKIAVFAGDGIGPEVTREALKVLDITAEMAGFKV